MNKKIKTTTKMSIPIDIQEGIKRLSMRTDISVDALLKRLKEICSNTPVFEDTTFQLRYAFEILNKNPRNSGIVGHMVLLHKDDTSRYIYSIPIFGDKKTDIDTSDKIIGVI